MLFLQDQTVNKIYFKTPHDQVAEADTFSRYKKGLDKFMDNRSVNSIKKSSAL